MYHFNVQNGKLTKVFTARYYQGIIWRIIPTARSDIGLLSEGGLIFVSPSYDALLK